MTANNHAADLMADGRRSDIQFLGGLRCRAAASLAATLLPG